MKTSDILLIVLAIFLIIGMFLTAFFGRGSRHGYGMIFSPNENNVIFHGLPALCNKNLTITVVIVS
jgi:hypothetical protein